MKARKAIPVRATDSETPARVEKDDPIHMQGMRDLVGMGVSVRQGDPFAAMRVDLDFHCGTAYVRLNEGDFALSLAICFVALQLQNCSVKGHTSYEYRLEAGEIDAQLTETRQRATGSGAEIGADARGEANARTGLTARLGISGKLGAKRSSDSTSKETVRRKRRLDLVTPAGQNRWQVGDAALGDARRTDGKLLGSYFNENRDDHGDAMPLCTIVGDRKDAFSVVTVQILARLGQVIVEFDGSPATIDQREDVEATLRKRSARTVAAQDRQVADLRSRVAGIVFTKAMQTRQDPDRRPYDGEVLLAQQSFVAAPVETAPSRTDQA